MAASASIRADLMAERTLAPASAAPAELLAGGGGSADGSLDVGFLDTLAGELDLSDWNWETMDAPVGGALDSSPLIPLPPIDPASVAPARASVPLSVFSDPLSEQPTAQTEQQLPPRHSARSPAPSSYQRTLSPDTADLRHLAALPHDDGRQLIGAWDRRSSEPNPSLDNQLDRSPDSPMGHASPLGRPASSLQRTSAENGYAGLLALDRSSAGVQRRRGLRRGSSARGVHHEAECRLADLSVQLEKALSTNAMLEGRNQLLEQFVGLQAKYTAPGGPPPPVHLDAWWLDTVTRQMVEQRLNLSGMLTFTLRGGRPINLTREQVAALSWLEFCKLWKDYMAALREGLAEVQAFTLAHPGQECPAAKRLARLVYETGILRGCLQTASPNRHAALLCFLPDGEPRPPLPDAGAWRAVAAALSTTPHQRAQLSQLRVMYLRVLGRMARQRHDLVATLQAAVPVADGGDVGSAGYEAALDGLEQLRAVLRDEHSLLTQYKMIVWGRVFTPVQAAIATVQAYPWAADLPAIVNCIADDMGEPSCATLLSGQA